MRVAVIPAKGGSVRIPKKNIKKFFGRPIIEYTIETAKRTGIFDRIIVSTDDEEVALVARAAGAEVMMRPDYLGDVGTQDIGRLVVDRLSDKDTVPRYACVMYATCPLLLPEDVLAGWRVMNERHPLFAMAVGTEPLRDAGAYYWGEGWAFVSRKPLIDTRTAMVPLPEERVVDINLPEDWAEAERRYAARQQAAACAAS